MKKILICYYSETNSTEEVCSNIKNTLDESYDVSMMTIKQVNNLSDYDTVLIAAPVHGMRWHQDAFDFITTNEKILKQKEVVYVALASMAYTGRHFWQKKIFKVLDKPSKIVQPIETAVFGGVFGDIPPILAFVFGIPKDVKKDQRDWKMIEEWKKKLIKHI